VQLCRAIFLDRDGTLNHDVGYTYRQEDLRLIDNAVGGLRVLYELGFVLIVASNQSGLARGLFREEQMHAFNTRLADTLRSQGVPLAGFYFSPYLVDAAVAEYRRESSCRKPGAGMLLQAAKDHGIDLHRSYAIGDKRSDVAAGRAAGCRTILLRTGYAGSDDCPEGEPDWFADDLMSAAHLIKALELAQPTRAATQTQSKQ
jgi:D-glycero-D-manno-heptose 1,7-bisphosphate phosphatase